MELLEILNMMGIKGDYQVWSISLDKKTGSRTSVNDNIAGELHKPLIEKFKRRESPVKF